MNLILAPLYNSLIGSRGAAISSHIDSVPGYGDENEDYFCFSVRVLDGLLGYFSNFSGRNIPIISFPLEATISENKFIDFDLTKILRTEEPPSVYLCSEFDLFSFSAEESISFKKKLDPRP